MKYFKILNLKSHDYHVLMQNLLLIVLWHVLDKLVQKLICNLCMFYRDLCTKMVDFEKLVKLEEDVKEILYLLEKYFSLHFLISWCT